MPEQPTSVFKIVINGSIRDVWREITRTDAPIACFFNNRMHLGPGGLAPGTKLAMRTPDSKYTGVVGEILEFDPPRRFSHTFRFTNLNDPPCAVVYDLREVPEGTEFTLTIRDIPVGTKTAKQMTSGGRMIVNTLKSVIETGRPAFGIRMLYVLFKILPAPKACRSENWPVAG
ncbi:MAG: SRPBCC domain-containing protein [Phycisphaeraceae bacterium]|nr:SRPBCC domain-containing protein [Phycisphaeraceae bacterium]